MDESVRVLHVDDDPAFGRLVADRLDREGDFEVVTEGDAAAGLDRLAADPGIDCVVSDYEMPDTDGLAFLAAVREEHDDLPFVLFTGRGSEAVASDAIAAGATDYLRKGGGPERYELLANRVRNAVEAYRSRRRAAERERVERVVREIDRALVRAETRREIEGAACRILADADPYLAAAVGTVDPGAGTVEVRARACDVADGDGESVDADGDDGDPDADADGDDGEDVDADGADADGDRTRRLDLPVGPDGAGRDSPVSRAHRERRVAVSGDLDDDPALARLLGVEDSQVRSLAVVPLDHGGESYGLLGVCADRPGAFDDRERELLGELGDDIAHALDARATTRELRRRTEHLETLLETVPMALFALDDEGTYTLSRGRALDRVGLAPGEVVGESAFELYADHPDIVEDVRRALDGDRVHRRVELDGGVFETWYRPVLDDGEVRRVVGVAFDATDRVAFERTLAALHDVATDLEACESVDAVADRTVAAAQDILEFDVCGLLAAEGDRLELVAASESLPSEVATGIPIEEGIAGETYRTGEPMLVEDLETHPAAEPRGHFRSAVSVPVGDRGIFQAVAGDPDAFDDRDRELAALLSSHAAANIDRVERERSLRWRNDLLDEFASVVSHDLRGPLEVAAGRLELARADPDGDRLPEHLDEAADAVDRTWTLVEDLLELARQGDRVADGELPEDTVALDEVAADAWEWVDAPDATLRVETDRRVVAHRRRLEQLLENLFRNSVEHGSTGPRPPAGDDAEPGTAPARSGGTTAQGDGGGPDVDGDGVDAGGAGVRITVGDLADGEGFFVADDGPGIPPAERESVFEAGYSTAERGTGFGLRVVELVAEGHGWTTTVTESGAGGARFEFRGVDRPRD